MYQKKSQISASTYKEATIRIPVKRLVDMLEVGDVIYAFGRFRCSRESYVVTAIHWWGVYAIPDPVFVNTMLLNRSSVDTISHQKLKWGNIEGIDFCANERTYSVQLAGDVQDIWRNPAVKERYPELYAEVTKHEQPLKDTLYKIKFVAWQQYKRYMRNKTIGHIN